MNDVIDYINVKAGLRVLPRFSYKGKCRIEEIITPSMNSGPNLFEYKTTFSVVCKQTLESGHEEQVKQQSAKIITNAIYGGFVKDLFGIMDALFEEGHLPGDKSLMLVEKLLDQITGN